VARTAYSVGCYCPLWLVGTPLAKVGHLEPADSLRLILWSGVSYPIGQFFVARSSYRKMGSRIQWQGIHFAFT
jgi:hypothetical protein